MKNELSIICEQLLGAAASGIYQGILITALPALVLKCTRQTNAATRHAVWCCILSLVTLVFLTHITREGVALFKPASWAAPSSTFDETALLVSPPFRETSLSQDQPAANLEDAHPDFLATATSPLALNQPPAAALLPDTTQIPPLLDALIQSAIPLESDDSMIQRLKAGFSALLTPILFKVPMKLPGNASTLVVASAMAFALFRIIVLSVQLWRLRKLKSCGKRAGPDLQCLFENLCAELKTKRRVQLRVLPGLNSPLFLGFLNPVILVPAEQGPDEAEQLLRHELAHLSRRDDWTNLFQQFTQATFSFHPAVWWISRRLTLEREIACDDQVLQAKAGRKEYALLLATIAGRMRGSALLLAPGASTNKSQLQQRINMILDTSRNISPRLARSRLGWMACAAALIAFSAAYSAPRISLAQDEATAVASLDEASDPLLPPAEGAPEGGPPPGELPPIKISLDAVPGLSAAVVAAPADIPGPKIKAGPNDYSLRQRPQIKPGPDDYSPLAAVPVPPAPAVAPAPPIPLVSALEPRPPTSPRPARAPRAENRDELLERVERLEKLVQSLVAREQAGSPQPFYWKPDLKMDGKDLKSYRLDPKEMDRIKEQAKREAERAVEDSKRIAKEAEKQAKTLQKRSSYPDQLNGQRQQLEALRKQLQMLEQQKEQLSHEIERLEKDRQKFEQDQSEDRGEIELEYSVTVDLAGQKPAEN